MERPHPGKRTSPSSLRWLLILVAATIVLCMPLALPMACNNFKFSRFTSEVDEIPLPAQSELIFKSSDFGLLWGTSNGCAHQVRMLIASELEFDAVVKHYSAFSLKHPDESSSERVRPRVIPFDGEPNFEKSGSELFYPLFPQGKYKWFIVEFEGWTEPGLDFRCG